LVLVLLMVLMVLMVPLILMLLVILLGLLVLLLFVGTGLFVRVRGGMRGGGELTALSRTSSRGRQRQK